MCTAQLYDNAELCIRGKLQFKCTAKSTVTHKQYDYLIPASRQ